MIFISLSILIVAIKADNALVKFPSNICGCGQIVSQLDCTLANRCMWNFKSTSCEDINCPNIQDQYSCALNSYCYWNGAACIQFKSNKLNCEVIPTTKSCESSNIFCVNSTGGCIKRSSSITSCSSITTLDECLKNSLACAFEAGKCQQISCSNLKIQEDCLYYATDPTYQKIQLCTWQNQNCIPATTSQVAQYSYNTCFIHTLGAYTYSSNNVNDEGNFTGHCVSCFDLILSGLILLGTLII